jgi:cell division septation protein DedD
MKRRAGILVLGALLLSARAQAQGGPDGGGQAPPPEPTTPTGQATERTATPTTPATPTPASESAAPETQAAPAADDTAADAQVAAILADQTRDSGESAIKIYGFADFSLYGWTRTPGQWAGVLNDKLSFAVGKLNVYMDTDIATDWKSMVEVRFMFVPQGTETLLNGSAGGIPSTIADPLANSGRYMVPASDYSDVGRPVPWGAINIERAYLEHTFSSYLRLRAGRFLTPWGIWNVDHGSPVIIGPVKPYVIGEQFFPEAQTGFELLGSMNFGENGTIGYHLTLSNGRGPVEQYQDYDSNKAIGGRLYLRGFWLGDLTIGTSAYGGTVTDRRREIDLATQQLRWFNFEHYRELSLAADVRWLWRGLHLQAEAAVHQKVWNDGERPVVANFTNTVIGAQPDLRRVGFYVLAGYRLPWFNLMPYLLYTYYDTDQKTVLVGSSRVEEFAGGLNIRVTPRVVLKGEWGRAIFLQPLPGSPNVDSLDRLDVQAAWVF